MRRKKINPDMLRQKQAELNDCVAEFDSTVSMITDAVDNLTALNIAINERIDEIDAYSLELVHVRGDLETARQKNERVIRNFNALVGED